VRRRVLTVALAIVLAVLGTAGVLAYVHQADVRAVAGQRAVHVLVATQQIPEGTSAQAALSGGLLRKQILPASSVPPDAVRKLTPDLANLVMSTAVAPGQLLLLPMLVTSAAATGSLLIPKNMIAVSILICLPEDVAGAVQAGSHVAVFDTYATAGALTAQPDCDGPHQQQDFGKVHTRIVLPSALVLSVGSSAGGTATTPGATSTAFSSGSSSSSGTLMVTFAVDQADAERLIQMTEAGLPYLALLSGKSVTKPDTSLVPLLPPVK
jgi:pilus assembly protein CpaB